MSRVANNPVVVPAGIDVDIAGGRVAVKGAKGALALTVHGGVDVVREEGTIKFAPRDGSRSANALAGTTRALVNNMVVGVSQGFRKQLKLVGVGYRAQAKGNTLNLHLGFSHPVDFSIPDGITIDTPSPTDIIVSGIDKQQVGQVAANIRAYRSPEPYKGKGVRYADEMVRLKEAKKK